MRRRRKGRASHGGPPRALSFATITFALSAIIVLAAGQETAREEATSLANSELLAEPAAGPDGDGSRGATSGTVRAGTASERPETTTASSADERSGSHNCDHPLVLVDRSHALPADYAPQDLVPLSSQGIPTFGGDLLLRRVAAEDLGSMVSAAAGDGVELVVASAYRSYAEQEASHVRLTSVYGEGAMSAPPGHSQHQLGTAVDLTNAQTGYEVSEYFGQTSAYAWLSEHAGEHGYVLAYPPNRRAETGYGWEPWHYRHIGVENVERLADSGLGLQAFLAAEGVIPRC